MSLWYGDHEVLSGMSLPEASARLEAMEEFDLALELQRASPKAAGRLSTFGVFDAFSGPPKPWMHSTHVFGFLPQSPPGSGDLKVLPPGQIEPNLALKGGRINVSLNRLRIAEYPGRGSRQILFDFSGQNHLKSGVEEAHFNMTFRASENALVGVINYPIFVGLHVGPSITMIRCFTVNVQNDQDEKILSTLESEVFKKGLKLAKVAQPALVPLSEIAMGLTRTVASRHHNAGVQNIQMGLDFGGSSLGARLALGDYIAVQVPIEAMTGWDWDDYMFRSKVGEIVRSDDGSPIPYNYLAFGVSAYTDGNT